MSVTPPVLTNPITADVNPAGSTINVPSGRDAIIRMPRDSAGRFIPVDGPITIRGGRNKSIPAGGILGGAKTKPSGSYDSPNRGIKLSDGDDVPWTFHMEGVMSLLGRYHSDIFQCAVRTNNAVSIAIKNCRWDSYSWGQQSSVHADTFQIWGGALNVDIENFVATHATYQSMYWDSGDGRNLPTGPGKRPWTMENMYIQGDPAAGGFHYLYANREAAWADVRAKDVYFSPGGNDIFDNFGKAVPGMKIGTPPKDYAPLEWWKDGFYNPTGVVTPPPVDPPPVDPPPATYLYRAAKVVHKYDMKKDLKSDSAWNVSLGLRDRYPTYWTGAPTEVYTQALIDAVAKWQREVMKWSGTGADGFAGPTTCSKFGLVWDATATPPVVTPPPAKSVYSTLVTGGIPAATVDTCLDAAAVAVHGSASVAEAEAKLTDRTM